MMETDQTDMTEANKPKYTGNLKQSKYAHMRWLYLVLGFVFFALGMLGTALPVLPTTPFVLLAAACWARGSKRFYLWLINHDKLGKYVRDWERRRAVPRKAKWLACIMMSISSVMLFFTMPDSRIWVAWVVAVVCCCVAIYLWRLPDS